MIPNTSPTGPTRSTRPARPTRQTRSTRLARPTRPTRQTRQTRPTIPNQTRPTKPTRPTLQKTPYANPPVHYSQPGGMREAIQYGARPCGARSRARGKAKAFACHMLKHMPKLPSPTPPSWLENSQRAAKKSYQKELPKRATRTERFFTKSYQTKLPKWNLFLKKSSQNACFFLHRCLLPFACSNC